MTELIETGDTEIEMSVCEPVQEKNGVCYLSYTGISMRSRIKFGLRYEGLWILSQGLPRYDSRTQGVITGVEKHCQRQILLPLTASSLFGHLKIT